MAYMCGCVEVFGGVFVESWTGRRIVVVDIEVGEAAVERNALDNK